MNTSAAKEEVVIQILQHVLPFNEIRSDLKSLMFNGITSAEVHNY